MVLFAVVGANHLPALPALKDVPWSVASRRSHVVLGSRREVRVFEYSAKCRFTGWSRLVYFNVSVRERSLGIVWCRSGLTLAVMDFVVSAGIMSISILPDLIETFGSA